MTLRPIKNKKDYEAYLAWVDSLFDKKIKPTSPEGETLQVALLLIKQYEDLHFQIPYPDPIEAIKAKMEEKGLRKGSPLPWNWPGYSTASSAFPPMFCCLRPPH